jgi:hypothetical protein
MGDTFPELKGNEKKIHDIIRDEEESFENTLAKVILVFKWFCITVNLFGQVYRSFLMLNLYVTMFTYVKSIFAQSIHVICYTSIQYLHNPSMSYV